MEVRVRYAPSPTGLQHIGGVRTALFNYLFARSRGGKFILRLEDTDRARSSEEFTRNLYDTFAWLGLHWDEGPDVGGPMAPYVQSERSGEYRKYAGMLLDQGLAYYCFCTPKRLDAIRARREASHSSETGYDRNCRFLPREEAARRAAAGEPRTIRLKIPLWETVVFHDELLGDIEWKTEEINPDPVLIKSDGFPTYHLANVVDDHLMGTSHVLRAQEWLPSTPLHVIMYRAFGWDPPVYCHLPMVMGQDGKKLSKRHGATSIDEFRRQGYLKEALINYVALLGASYEEGKELYTLEELAGRFSLDKLNKAPAAFDYKKLEWYNGRYIRTKTDAELAELALPFAVEQGLFGSAGQEPAGEQRELFYAAMVLVKERALYLKDIPGKLRYLFTEPPVPAAEAFIPKKSTLAAARELIRKDRELIGAITEAASTEEAEAAVKAFAEKEGIAFGDLLMPLRVAITGERVSPPLLGSVRVLGAARSLERIDRAIAAVG